MLLHRAKRTEKELLEQGLFQGLEHIFPQMFGENMGKRISHNRGRGIQTYLSQEVFGHSVYIYLETFPIMVSHSWDHSLKGLKFPPFS